MASTSLRVVEVKPLQKGSDDYETKRAAILQEFADKIPKEYHLPQDIVENPPLDVTDIPRSCGILSSAELDITEKYSAAEIAEAVAKGQLTAVDVATAFCKRAAIAHQLTCCLTDWFMDEALERARYLDEYLKKNGRPVGPLHGVPISLKEHMPIKGRYASWGFLATRTLCEEDCHMVSILREAGAVFFAKTTQPQAIMHLECTSYHGRTLMPRNINLSSGGSSGGEAALGALRGAALGVGTDIGGSIRGPAGFCGIYGFKPTAYTLPMKDFLPGGFPAELNILASVGPMCNSLRDCDLFVRVVKAANPHLIDPRVHPTPWTGLSTSMQLPLKVGVMKNDGVIIPQPPVLKALAWAEKQLSSLSDVVLKPYSPYQTSTAMFLIRKAYWPESGHTDINLCETSGEPMHPLTEWIIKDAKDKVQRTGTEINEMRWARDSFRSEFAQHWNQQDVDFVLAPVFVGPASAHDSAFYWNYTALWNYVDYPGFVFPTPITADKKKEEYAEEHSKPLGPEDEHVRKMWQETNFEGAPINLQLIARKWHDNQLFGALQVMADALKLS